jgi:pimeloyl-ACP methyl ester carboxylesterase
MLAPGPNNRPSQPDRRPVGRIVIYGLILLGIVIAGAFAWLYTPDEQRAALMAKYAQAPSEFLDAAGVTLHVRDTGPRTAPAIVLLHGFGSSLQTWDDWAQDLQTDHRVIRYDMPGFGLTGADPSGDYTDARSVAVLLALLDRLGIARASIVGNSMGGRIAWTFAALHPERVDKLVLVSPDGFASPGLEYGVAPKVPLMMRALPYVLPSFMLRASLAPAYANPGVITEPLFTRYRDMMLAPGVRRAIVRRMGQQVLVDPVPLLKQIEAPTLLMWGEKDGMIPFANSADYLRALPHATLAALPGIGHLPQEEAPATVGILRQFLDR